MKSRFFASVVLSGVLSAAGASGAMADEQPHKIPAPASTGAAVSQKLETIVLAGGCFWGVQGVFQHVKGVTQAVSGYAGGDAAAAHYELTSRGDTGHAEAVQVMFDPAQVSLGQILQVYFAVAHDPTQRNRQGPDHGTQYRSAIFPADDEQAKEIRAYIAQLDQAHAFRAPIATTIEPGKAFYPAEAYHQDYLTRHPDDLYIVFNDRPKVEALKQLYPEFYRAQPVLVGASGGKRS